MVGGVSRSGNVGVKGTGARAGVCKSPKGQGEEPTNLERTQVCVCECVQAR